MERDIERIEVQLQEAEGTDRELTPWWHKARTALRHKQRERRIMLARAQRLNRKLAAVKPDARKAEAKAQLREVLHALFFVARTSLTFYEEPSEGNETAFTDALDRLDQLVPDWDKPQDVKPKPLLQRMGLGE
jgi:predicted secreted Zn-dependent protease